MLGKMTANVLLTQSLSVELGSAEPWPHDVALYQTYEVKRGQRGGAGINIKFYSPPIRLWSGGGGLKICILK